MRQLRSIVLGMLTGVLAAALCFAESETPDPKPMLEDSAVAKVVDFRGPVTMVSSEGGLIQPGKTVHPEDVIEVYAQGHCVLLFEDGVVRTYDGPVTIYFNTQQPGGPEGLLQKLAHAVVEVFFASDKDPEDAQLGSRTSLSNDPIDRVPRLVYPPCDILLLDAPTYLKWRYVEGVTDYAVSVYEGKNQFFDTVVSDTSVKLDPKRHSMKAGASYVWRVRAIVGDSCLRSRSSSFRLVDDTERAEISDRVKSLDDTVGDARLTRLMRALLYREAGLKLNCCWELDAILSDDPDDVASLRVKADVLYEMGLEEEALATYRKLLN